MPDNSSKPRGATDDLEAMNFGGLPWDRDNLADSLGKAYDLACKKTLDAIKWYQSARKKRRVAAQGLRFLAALLIVGGTLVPVLKPLYPDDVPAEVGYVLIVASGACLLINRAMGLSSGWIRYIRTSFILEKDLDAFQLDWAKALADMGGRPETPKQVDDLLDKLRSFVAKVNRVLLNEMDTWADQFNQDLALLEGASNKSDRNPTTDGKIPSTDG